MSNQGEKASSHKSSEFIALNESSAPSHLIVGLGNPGAEYAKNRHNIGFQCIDHLAQACGIKVSRRRHKALLGKGRIGEHHVIVVKPLTFMNNSGQAVQRVSSWYKIPPERILVIYDELDLPVGRIRLRSGGSSGGHKGCKSIIAALGTQGFARLRIGIGRPVHGDPVDYVLSDFDREQEPIIKTAREQTTEIVSLFLNEGIREAMNTFNGKRTEIAGDD